jgi:hypothetical protein
MLRIEKIRGKKCFFKKISLPRASKLALGKEIFAECFLFGSQQRNLCQVFCIWL